MKRLPKILCFFNGLFQLHDTSSTCVYTRGEENPGTCHIEMGCRIFLCLVSLTHETPQTWSVGQQHWNDVHLDNGTGQLHDASLSTSTFRSTGPHRHKDPTNHGLWNAPYLFPWNQNVGSLRLCGLCWAPQAGTCFLCGSRHVQASVSCVARG